MKIYIWLWYDFYQKSQIENSKYAITIVSLLKNNNFIIESTSKLVISPNSNTPGSHAFRSIFYVMLRQGKSANRPDIPAYMFH